MQLEGECHPYCLSRKSPAAPAVTCGKFMQSQYKKAREDGEARPLVSFCDYISSSGSPLLASQEGWRSVQFGMIRESGGDGAHGEDENRRQSASPA